MDALTKQSIQRLCERLGAFRLRGPIRALMAEFRPGVPKEETCPLEGFADAACSAVVRWLPDGQQFVRSVWLAGDSALVEEFRIFCEQADRLVVPLLHSAGFQVGRHAPNSQARWQWAVFELGEMQVFGTSLRLVGKDVFRRAGPSIKVGEGMVLNPKHWAKQDPFAPLIAAAGNTRYWQLADAVEASLAAVDIALIRQEPAAVDPETATPTNSRPRRRRSTRKIDVDRWLGKVESDMRKERTRELGSESAADEALISQLYSLSAEDLAPMLERVGCKTSAKTIRRRGGSTKYAAWEQYRKPTAPASVAADLGPAGRTGVEEGEAPGPSRAMAAAAAVGSGQLSERVGGRGTTHTGKTAVEKATEDAADRFAREAGVDIPPAE